MQVRFASWLFATNQSSLCHWDIQSTKNPDERSGKISLTQRPVS